MIARRLDDPPPVEWGWRLPDDFPARAIAPGSTITPAKADNPGAKLSAEAPAQP